MDNRNTRQKQREERLKYIRIQRGIRIGAILLAIVLAIIALAQGCSTRRAIEDLAAQLRAKKLSQAQEELLAMQPSPSPSPEIDPASQGTSITLSFVGEVGLGVDNNLEEGGYRFNELWDENGPTYFFNNVKSIFEGDDLTACSLFGSITLNTDPAKRRNWDLALRADPMDVEVFQVSGIDAVNLGNSHAYDYDSEGYVDTLANLDVADIGRFGYDIVYYEDIPGHTPVGVAGAGTIRVGFVGVWEDADIYYETTALEDIAYLQEKGCQLIILMVNWESKDPAVPDDKFIISSHKFIDAGADLIVGCNPTELQGIERYHGKTIVYSLGTFMSCDPELAISDTFIFQQTFTLVSGQVQPDAEFSVTPCLISGNEQENDLSPVIAVGQSQHRILDTIYTRSALLDGGVSRDDGGLPAALEADEAETGTAAQTGQIAPPQSSPIQDTAPDTEEQEPQAPEESEPDTGESGETGGTAETVGYE